MNKFEILIDELGHAIDQLEKIDEPDLAAAVYKATDVLQTLERWCDAYPEKIFKPVVWAEVHKALEAANISGSAVAADSMRYTVKGFKKVLHDV